jgi:hypothetical protein
LQQWKECRIIVLSQKRSFTALLTPIRMDIMKPRYNMANPQELPTNKQVDYYFEDSETNIILEITNIVLNNLEFRDFIGEEIDLSDEALLEISSKLKKILNG